MLNVDTRRYLLFVSFVSFFLHSLSQAETVKWLKSSTNIFYAWHYYGDPKTPALAIKNVEGIMSEWNVPSFLTEHGGCAAWFAAANASISHSYWHYSSYCDTGPYFGNKKVPDDTFGGCLLGWAGGSTTSCT